MHFETKAIHAGLAIENPSKAIVPPIEPSTIFEHNEDGSRKGDLKYTRHANPNRLQWENILAELEGGEAALAFSSGMAAGAAIFQSLQPGDHALVPDFVYTGIRNLMEKIMLPWNLKVDFIDMRKVENVEKAIKKNTKLIWIETPSNPLLNITDIKVICALANKKNILTCVDNTWATPVNQLPLDLGADLVLHSTTKYFGGHSDILGGAVIAKSADDFFQKIREVQKIGGAVPSPRDCWLLARSTKTLSYRMEGHNRNAARLVEFLDNHSMVEKIFYPGLKSNPGHEIAKGQMDNFGGMISFLIRGDADDTLKVVAGSKLIKRATSLGGVETTWEHRRSSEGEGSETPENLIRISVGLEHPDDLIEDLKRALA